MQSPKVQLAIHKRMERGDQYSSEGLYDEAARMYLLAYKKSERDNIDILIKLVEAMIKIKKYDLALEIVDISMKEVPRSRSLHRLKALVYREKGDLLSEIKHLDKMIKLNKHNILPHIDKARAYKKLNKKKDSLKALDKAMKIVKKKDTGSLLSIAEAYIEVGAPEKAKKSLQIIEKQGELNKEYWLVLSKLHLSTDDIKGSMECVDRSLAQDGYWVEGLIFKFEIYERMGEDNKAATVLRNILDLQPSNHRLRQKYQKITGDLNLTDDVSRTKGKYL